MDLTILPWLEEWYYSNVSDEHMIAMTVAAIQLHREQELLSLIHIWIVKLLKKLQGG